MTFFAKNQRLGRVARRARLAVGRRGVFIGQAGAFRDEWQLTNPQMVLFGAGDEDAADGEAAWINDVGELYPIYPLTKGVESWDLQRAITFALTVVDDAARAAARSRCAREYDVLDARHALDWIHAPGRPGRRSTRAQHRFRFEEALVTQLVLARRRPAVRALGAQPRAPAAAGLLAAFDARLPVRADPRASARSARRSRRDLAAAAPDEPPAPGRGRLRQDAGRAARDAARRRLRRPGGAARADRGARPAAPPLDHRDARRPRRRRDARRRRRGHRRRAAHRAR